jgi:hypothetical protein
MPDFVAYQGQNWWADSHGIPTVITSGCLIAVRPLVYEKQTSAAADPAMTLRTAQPCRAMTWSRSARTRACACSDSRQKGLERMCGA